MDADDRFQALEMRLQQIEERLSRLERSPASDRIEAARVEPSPVVTPTTESGPAPLLDLTIAGKSILILGGAFLLRAATERATLPKQVGVTLGLLYAAAWIVVAAIAARGGRRTASVFSAAAAAVIAYPIVWEATTRFGVLTATTAAAILALFSVALIAAGRMYAMIWLAWIAAAGATFDAMLLAYATKELIPFLIELTVIGTVALILRLRYVGWLLAIESDLFAIMLTVTTLIDAKPPAGTILWLILFAAAWLVKPGLHGVATALVGFGGSAAIVMIAHVPPLPTAILLLIVAGGAYLLAFRRDESLDSTVAGIAALSATLILLLPIAQAIVWGAAAVATAEIARRKSSTTFLVQSAVWGAAAAFASLPIAAAFCFVAFLRRRNIILLAIATGGAAYVLIEAIARTTATEGVQALVRTIVLAVAALLLALAGRRWQVREASQLATLALVITGVQIVFEDLRSGSASTMFLALAVYGGAMVAIARLRRVPALSP